MQGPFFVGYGAGATVQFVLYDSSGKTLQSSATIASGDVKIIKDGGAATNTTNLPTNEGAGVYSLTLTAAETQAERLTVILDDASATETFLGTALHFVTVGNASATLDFDLMDATPDVNTVNSPKGSVSFTVGSTNLTATTCSTNLSGTYTTDNIFQNRLIVWLTGSGAGSVCFIEAYDGSTGDLTFSEAIVTPANGDTGLIV